MAAASVPSFFPPCYPLFHFFGSSKTTLCQVLIYMQFPLLELPSLPLLPNYQPNPNYLHLVNLYSSVRFYFPYLTDYNAALTTYRTLF